MPHAPRPLRCLTATLLMALAGAANAQLDQAQPASPEHGRVTLSSQFRFPDDFVARSQSTLIICQVLVSKRGEVGARKCAQHGGTDRLQNWMRNEIHYRLQRARFRPARVGGEAVAVSMPLRVLVDCDSRGSCSVAVYPNTGLHLREHGDAYYAPQEIITKTGTWYDRLVASGECRAGKADECTDITAFAFGAAVRVSADGLVTGVGVVDGVEVGDFPVEAALEHLVESRYIPAQTQAQELTLLVHTPTIHKRNSRYIRRNQCRREEVIGTRIAMG
ncbi:MAG: hypothetical protein AAFX85_19755, partial [Pseudomonadota bacterium]